MSSAEDKAEDRIRTYAFLDPLTGEIVRVRTCRPSERMQGLDPSTPCVEATSATSLGSHRGVRRPDGSWELVPIEGAATASPFGPFAGLPL